jgi:valyl-tRNA synthetase
MAGIFFTGKVPFKTLLIHGLVRDESNKKFSKSSGNAPDVNKLIDEFGADGLRGGFALCSNFDEECILTPRVFPTGKHFANKLWNAFKFFVFNAKNLNYTPQIDNSKKSVNSYNDTIIKWIYTELYETICEINAVNKTYDFLKYAKGLYKFFWNRFCDWYIEITKEKIKKGQIMYIDAGLDIIRRFIVWWHPIQPFVTEFIYQALPIVFGNPATEKWQSILQEKLDYYEIDNSFYQAKEIIESVMRLEEFFRLVKYFKKISAPSAVSKGKGTFQIALKKNTDKISEVIELTRNFENIEVKETVPKIYYSIEILDNEVFVEIEKEEKFLKFLVNKLNEKIEEETSLLKEIDGKLSDEKFLESASSVVVEKHRKLQLRLRKELGLLSENKERILKISEGVL